jgi:hypothetical protein
MRLTEGNGFAAGSGSVPAGRAAGRAVVRVIARVIARVTDRQRQYKKEPLRITRSGSSIFRLSVAAAGYLSSDSG